MIKKIYLSVLLLTVIVSSLFAQTGKHCFTDEVYREEIIKHPEYLLKQKQLEEFTYNYIQANHSAQRTAQSTVIIIPVVFHVIHQYGSENIGEDQILDEINILNRDYNLLNADTINLIPAFVGMPANIGIEFRLATIDPNGNCTNGIERIPSFRTNIADDLAKINPWPRDKYLNIWTVAKFGPAHASAAAYSTYPATSTVATDGVISLNDYVGSIGTSNLTNSRTLTHEIGHYLNLLHPWGNTNQPGVSCTGTDSVSDTPTTKGWSFCPSSNFDVCIPGIDENFQNYMDYSYCDVMFTNGQKNRMIAALNSTIASRINLWSPGNLTATGTDGSPAVPCAPIADFFVAQDHVCLGDSAQFMSNCFNSDTVSYSWSFPSGSPSTSTLQNPNVAYAAAGQYNATLIAYNTHGGDTITKNLIVTVHGPTTFTPNYFDDFETPGTFPGTGYVINDAGNAWTRITTTGYSGTACIKMLNYSQGQQGLVDSYVTPGINTTGYNSSVLTFRMAYAQKDITKTDVLRIYVSTTCGKYWNLRRTLSGAQLSVNPVVSGSFTPTSQSQWGLFTLSNISTINNHSDARIKFEFTSGGDNNIYIDDINLTANPTGIEEDKIAALNFDVYPNPSNDRFSIVFEMPQFDKAELKITDMLGREVKTVAKEQLASGIHEYSLNAGEFSKGIYLVSLRAGETSTVKKLVID
jgi:PKD repeat protein